MKKARIFTILSFVMAIAFSNSIPAYPQMSDNKTQTLPDYGTKDPVTLVDSLKAANDSLISLIKELDLDKERAREVAEILRDLKEPNFRPTVINKVFGPWVFSGYRNISKKTFDTTMPVYLKGMEVMTSHPEEELLDSVSVLESLFEPVDSLAPSKEIYIESFEEEPELKDIDILAEDITPRWLHDALTAYRIQEDFMYSTMIDTPKNIEFAYWDLPVPPRLAEDDVSFAAFIKKLDLPEVDTKKAQLVEKNTKKIHWLHTLNGNMQFSQVYLSSNWYQGGINNVSSNLNLSWNVNLNQVYHPNYMFNSAMTYRFGLQSTPQDEVRDYSISQDNLQHVMNVGIHAIKKWYYSMSYNFTTALFNNYNANSHVRKASFLSPGDLTLGLGMTYNTKNKKGNFELTTSINPLSYNLKMCLADNDVIPHGWFGIDADKRTKSSYGSNGTLDIKWQILWNVRYTTRLYLFTNYTNNDVMDWQHTFNFDVNKYLTTSLFLNLRYDSSIDPNKSDWKKFMLKEVFGFGLTYTISTKK